MTTKQQFPTHQFSNNTLKEMNENQYRIIQKQKNELEIYKILAEERGKGLANIYNIATSKSCMIETALGLATSAVDKISRQQKMLIEESKYLGVENLRLRLENQKLVNELEITNKFNIALNWDVNDLKDKLKSALEQLDIIGNLSHKEVEKSVSKPSPLCIPFSLSDLPSVPQGGTFVSQKAQRDKEYESNWWKCEQCNAENPIHYICCDVCGILRSRHIK